MPTTTETTILRGGEWLLQPSDADAVFTPERLTEEHRLIGRTAQEFVDNEVLPKLDQLETKDWALARELVKPRGRVSACSASTCPRPTAASASTRSPRSSSARRWRASASFGATFGAHANLTDRPARAVRQRGAEAEVPAEAAVRRDHRRLRLERNRIGIRRARRADARRRGRPTAASC